MKKIEKFAKNNKLKITNWAGSGDFGNAYHTECGKIIKETSDVFEFIIASKIESEKNDNIVDIYKTEIIGDSMFILMEELDLTNIEDKCSIIFSELDNIGYSIIEYDIEDNTIGFSDEELWFIDDIQKAIIQYQSYGFNPLDIKHDNIGRKKNGNFALFDQRDFIPNSIDLIKKYKKERKTKKLKI